MLFTCVLDLPAPSTSCLARLGIIFASLVTPTFLIPVGQSGCYHGKNEDLYPLPLLQSHVFVLPKNVLRLE